MTLSSIVWRVKPILLSEAAKTHLAILADMMAPMHISQGSKVVYKVQFSSLQFFLIFDAALMHWISAWHVESLFRSTEFLQADTTTPSSSTMTAPI